MNAKQKTLQSYNDHAAVYAEKFKSLLAYQKDYQCRMFELLLPGKRILDLGCGAGDSAFLFQEHGFDVLGVDFSPAMVALARQKGVRAEVMDIENLTVPDRSYDGIWAVTSLLHIEKARLPAVIDKLHHVLSDNGVIYICLKEGEGERMLLDKNEGGERFFAFWYADEFKKLFDGRFELVEELKADQTNTQFRSNIFLEFFFRKK